MALIETVTNRRHFLRGGLGLIITSPAIVRVASLMPLPRKRICEASAYSEFLDDAWAKYGELYEPIRGIRTSIPYPTWRRLNQGVELSRSVLRASASMHQSPREANPVPDPAQIPPHSSGKMIG